MYKGVNVENDTPPSLWQRIVLPNLCYNMVVLALLITTVVLSANTLNRVEKEVTTCRLRYEGSANDLNEQQFQAFAKSAGWTLTHPEAPDCNLCKEPDRFPVWMAPVDICSAFNLDVNNHPLCNSQIEQLEASHLKVCATQGQIDKAWADGGCHSGSGNQTQPFLGYDGALFCQKECNAGGTPGTSCYQECATTLKCQKSFDDPNDSCSAPYKKILPTMCQVEVESSARRSGSMPTSIEGLSATTCTYSCPRWHSSSASSSSSDSDVCSTTESCTGDHRSMTCQIGLSTTRRFVCYYEQCADWKKCTPGTAKCDPSDPGCYKSNENDINTRLQDGNL